MGTDPCFVKEGASHQRRTNLTPTPFPIPGHLGVNLAQLVSGPALELGVCGAGAYSALPSAG